MTRAILTRFGALASVLLTCGWHAVGNGGDPLRLQFFEAKKQAALVVSRMHPDAFTGATSAEVRQWILDNREKLAGTILAAEHVWLEQPEANCALAISESDVPVVQLSYPTCRAAATSVMSAGRLLVHESVHHLGKTDETFADEVAAGVYNAWQSGILEWQKIPASSAPEARSLHTAVFSNGKMLVWGGLSAGSHVLSDGAQFDPVDNTWQALPAAPAALAGRWNHESVVFGSKVIIWGGSSDVMGRLQNSGAMFDTSTRTWSMLPARSSSQMISNIGALQQSQTVVVTPTGIIVWGGASTTSPTGTSWRPEGGVLTIANARSTWRSMSTQNAPTRYSGHAAVWTGSEMIVWGGRPLPSSSGQLQAETNEGAVYNPATNTWRAMSSVNAPAARSDHTAIWTGSKMIVFGGSSAQSILRDSGGIYDPATDVWEPLKADIVGSRSGHSAIWTGDEMIVYGGKMRDGMYASVNVFNPITGVFRSMAGKAQPTEREQHTAVWTGMSMIVWGGTVLRADNSRVRIGDGGLYYP